MWSSANEGVALCARDAKLGALLHEVTFAECYDLGLHRHVEQRAILRESLLDLANEGFRAQVQESRRVHDRRLKPSWYADLAARRQCVVIRMGDVPDFYRVCPE